MSKLKTIHNKYKIIGGKKGPCTTEMKYYKDGSQKQIKSISYICDCGNIICIKESTKYKEKKQ